PAAQHAPGVLAAAAVRTLTVSAESDSCGSILVSWNPSILSDANTTANRHDATQNRNDTFAVPSGVSSWTNTNVNCKHKYTYNIRMSNAAGGPSTPSQQALCCTQSHSTHMSVIRHRFSEGK